VGDVRNIAKGKRLAAKSQQKIGLWPHGKLRAHLTYKASAAGIAVELVNEKDTSKSCPACGHQYKPKGRVYSCRNQQCRFVGHRDIVGSVNILSRHLHGKLCGVKPPPPYAATTYRHPALQGKRSPLDTGYMARPGSS
jgi:putative transposase